MKLAAILAAGAAVVLQSGVALACGGLVAPNGAIRLTRATTLVDWHDGVEHYLTSFSYQGSAVSDFGWIVPLPAVPDNVEEGGGWTLQRLQRATHPQPVFATGALRAASGQAADVLQTYQVKALDITVIRGSGPAITDWCQQNGFLLTPETRAHLIVYAHGSPVFMAAKYNVARAEATRQTVGDGAPVLVTMHVAHPWVPLEVLANGVETVNADLYLLSDQPLFVSDLAAAVGESPVGAYVPRAPGFAVQYQQALDPSLFRDLSSDKNMGWIRPGSILTYLTLEAPAATVSYDLGISSAGVLKVARYGTAPMAVTDPAAVPPPTHNDGIMIEPGLATLTLSLLALSAVAAALYVAVRVSRRGATA